MHTRKYIIKDGGLTLPVAEDTGIIQLRVILPGTDNVTIVNTDNYDFISYEYIISYNDVASMNVLNTISVKIGATIRRKADGKIFTGESTGVYVNFAAGLYPVLKEV